MWPFVTNQSHVYLSIYSLTHALGVLLVNYAIQSLNLELVQNATNRKAEWDYWELILKALNWFLMCYKTQFKELINLPSGEMHINVK